MGYEFREENRLLKMGVVGMGGTQYGEAGLVRQAAEKTPYSLDAVYPELFGELPAPDKP